MPVKALMHTLRVGIVGGQVDPCRAIGAEVALAGARGRLGGVAGNRVLHGDRVQGAPGGGRRHLDGDHKRLPLGDTERLRQGHRVVPHVRRRPGGVQRLARESRARVDLVAGARVHGIEADGCHGRGGRSREDVGGPAHAAGRGAVVQAGDGSQRVMLVYAGVVRSRAGLVEDSHVVGAPEALVVVRNIEVAGRAPGSAPAVANDEGAVAGGCGREVRGRVVVVPAHDHHRVVAARRGAVVVVARVRGLVVRRRRIHVERNVHAPERHQRVLDVVIVGRRSARRDPVDFLHVLARYKAGGSTCCRRTRRQSRRRDRPSGPDRPSTSGSCRPCCRGSPRSRCSSRTRS